MTQAKKSIYLHQKSSTRAGLFRTIWGLMKLRDLENGELAAASTSIILPGHRSFDSIGNGYIEGARPAPSNRFIYEKALIDDKTS